VNIILFGAPGAGKGTQANNIVRKYNLHKISTGDLLRQAIIEENDLSVEIKNAIDKGLFVSDKIINDLIINVLSNNKINSRLIFDGYPRNLNQAKNLDILLKKFNQKITYVFSLNVDKEIITKRISGREICSNCDLIFNKYFNPSNQKNHLCDPKHLTKRIDDNEEIIKNRFDTYLEKTLPILNFYKDQDLLHEINGMNEIDKIFDEIRAIIDPLQA
jgi:adenylate kinase